jgi:hypothetical protein
MEILILGIGLHSVTRLRDSKGLIDRGDGRKFRLENVPDQSGRVD